MCMAGGSIIKCPPARRVLEERARAVRELQEKNIDGLSDSMAETVAFRNVAAVFDLLKEVAINVASSSSVALSALEPHLQLVLYQRRNTYVSKPLKPIYTIIGPRDVGHACRRVE